MPSKHSCGDLEKHFAFDQQTTRLELKFRVHTKASNCFSKNEIFRGSRTKQYTETVARERINHRHCTLDYCRRERFTGLHDMVI